MVPKTKGSHEFSYTLIKYMFPFSTLNNQCHHLVPCNNENNALLVL